MSVGTVQKFSRVSNGTGPTAQLAQAGVFLGLCLIACSPANVKSPPVAPAASLQVNGTLDVSKQTHWDFFDVAGTRTPVLFSLPKAGNWEFDDQHTPWWVASNATLELKLEAKLWPERRQVTTQECLTDLHRWRPAESLGPTANLLESKVVQLPQGFDSQLTVTAGKMAGASNDSAVILLVGSEVAHCFAFVATLTPTKAIADGELLARTALVTEAIVPKIRLRAIEARIEPVNH